MSWQTAAGFLTVAVVGVVGIWMSRIDGTIAAIWIVAVAAGFTLQRSRFCFASAFRDLFLFGSGHVMKGILVGLAVGTLGFAAIMAWVIPNPALGQLPAEAHILPSGTSALIAGLLFGLGMVLSGGCVAGSMYRSAEGYVASWVTMAGIVVGLGALTHTWNWWYRHLISSEPRVWFPSSMGLNYTGAVAVTLLGLLVVFLLVTFREARAGLFTPQIARQATGIPTFTSRLADLRDTVFVRGWSVIAGGAALGGLGVLMYMIHMPLGITGELMRLSDNLLETVGVATPELEGLSGLGGCTGDVAQGGLLTHTFAITVGILPGALAGALFAGEFRLRAPAQRRRYIQSLIGGLMMGYAAGMALGCTIGAFFSAIPSLGLSGWVFGLGLAGGAFAGVQVIKRTV